MLKYTMSKLEEYAKELEIDTELSLLNIKTRQLSQPNIRHKWLYRLIQHKKKISELNLQLNDLIDELTNKEQKLANVSMPKVKAKIEKGLDVKTLKKQIQEERDIVEYLDGVQSILSSMSFDMKNIVEILKLEA